VSVPRKIIARAIPLVVAVVIAVDVWLAVDGRPGNTYSEILRRWGDRWPVLVGALAFGMGLLLGHWFGEQGPATLGVVAVLMLFGLGVGAIFW
jgi:hypothetical protein